MRRRCQGRMYCAVPWWRHITLLGLLLTCPLPLALTKEISSRDSRPLPLTRIEQLRELTRQQAALFPEVCFHAVVTYYDPSNDDMFVQDATAGTWVDIEGMPKLDLKVGDWVELRGVGKWPDFAPEVGKPRFRVLGRASLPIAPMVSFRQLNMTSTNSRRVQVEGTVLDATKQGEQVRLTLEVDGGTINVPIASAPGPIPANLVDARVRIQGVCGASNNKKNQLIAVRVCLPSLADLHVIEEGPGDPFSGPVHSISSILCYIPKKETGRVKVQGVVTYWQVGRGLFIQDGNDGLFVESKQRAPLEVGDYVEVAGFPSVSQGLSPILKHAVFRSLPIRVTVFPYLATALEVLQGEHDSELVSIKGQLLRVEDFHGQRLLTLDADSAIFEAGLSFPGQSTGLPPPEIGSLLELTGVCSIQTNEEGDPVGFLITLRSAQDIAILRTPSWWTFTLMLRMVAILAALVLGVALWVVFLKRQVAEKTESIRDSLQREAAARERYQELFENANDMVFTCDLEGYFSSLNKAGRRMTGCELPETLNMNLAQILAPEFAPLARQILQEASQEEQHTYEVEIVSKDNTRLRVDLGTRLVQRAGKPPEVQGIGRDITRHRRLEDQLRHAQKMEAAGRLAGGVAHDFNNLLTVISGFGQLVLARLDPTDPKYPHIAELLKAADRGATLTRQLLAFSRQQVLQPQVLDLNNTLANINSMLRHLIGEDIEVVVVPGEDLGRVKADPGEIDQVILNLAVNARDAMPHGGKLTLQTENVSIDEVRASSHYPLRPGQYVMLSVSDTGCGMDAETQKHIFEPFFTTKEQGKGTGLGLATVHGIVHQSGGFIYVYSELGGGSIFKIYLPRVDQVAEPAKSRQADDHHARGSETILVVEDEAMVRDLTLEVLKESGYTVISAERPDDALRISEQNQGSIDLLLTDVVMPGMSGLELAERLKPGRPKMKVLYVSGYTADAVARRGMSDPKTAFLQKPFAPGALVRKVREVLEAVNEQRPS